MQRLTKVYQMRETDRRTKQTDGHHQSITISQDCFEIRPNIICIHCTQMDTYHHWHEVFLYGMRSENFGALTEWPGKSIRIMLW